MKVSSASCRVYTRLVIVFALLAAILAAAPSATANDILVVDVATDGLSGPGSCTDAPGDCELGQAVLIANSTPGPDTIHFDIDPADCPFGYCEIQLSSPLTITDTVVLDGTTQPQGHSPQANVCATDTQPSRMRIQIESASHNVIYVDNSGDPSTIKGLALTTSAPAYGGYSAIRVVDGGPHIACNHIGTDAAGLTDSTMFFSYGVHLDGAAEGAIVGTDGDGVDDLGERNVFGWANTGSVYVDAVDDVWVAGNYIGVSADGASRISTRQVYILKSASNILIGSNEDGVSDELERNFITSWTGVLLQPDVSVDNHVVSNTFGILPSGEQVDIDGGVVVWGVGADNTGYEVRGNTIHVTEIGVIVDGADPGASVLIEGNVVTRRIAPYSTNGIDLSGAGQHVVRGNTILNDNTTGNHYGILVRESAGLAAGSTNNCLLGNTLGISNTTGSNVDFSNNWWGSTDGPSGDGPGSGDPVSVDVTFDPWLTSPPEQCNTAPSVTGATYTVAEDVAVGTALGTISATDDGAASLTYSIESGDPDGLFAIDAGSGELTVTKGLNYEVTSQHVLTVAAADPFDTGTATVTVNVTDVAEPPTFSDVGEGHTFYGDIEWLAGKGITKGCNPPDNTLFCPDASVTRGQMAAFLHRALGDTLTEGPEPDFTDIDGSIFSADIVWLGSVGVTKGCNPPTNDQYCPNDVVTRGQMAAFLVRAFGYTAGAGSDRFSDDDDSVFEADIERLAEAGVTQGCNPPTNDQFCPASAVTRAQMAAFLHRAMG